MDKETQDGFKNFARIPNMLFVSFQHLSKEEKFLYCTLKCIYWDGKTRYVSLRELGEAVGYSTGALSKMLPRLHTCGLVDAKIQRELDKKGRPKGNPKYQITVLDIWDLNTYYYSCSPNERDLLDPSLKLVQQMNEPVHENVQGCSPNDTSSFTKTDKPDTFGEQDQAQVERAKDILKDPPKTSIKKDEKSPAAQSESVSPFSQEEIEFLSWLEEKGIPWKEKEVDTVKQQIAFVRDRISTKETLHRYCDHVRTRFTNTVWLANLAKDWLLNEFLRVEQTMQQLLPAQSQTPIEMPSQSDIEALAAQILQEYPEIVIVLKEDETYGPFLELPNGLPYPDGARNMQEWIALRDNPTRLNPVLEYSRRFVGNPAL